MYAGHLGVALWAKGACRAEALAVLIAAALAPDLVGACLSISGIGDPGGLYSHSLPAAGLIAAAGAAGMYAAVRSPRRSLAMGLVALSHPLLDYLTSLLPTWPGGPSVGLNLYRFPAVDFLLESGLVLVGWHVYRGTLAEGLRHSWAAWLVLAVPILSQGVFALLFAGAAAGG